MKKLMNLSKLAIAALVTSGLFVACSEEISENTVDTQYTAQTGNIGNAGQAVDLGLPSGTLWANKNVGASSESDNGILFIWGDITGKKIDADKDATYTKVTDITSFDELFNNFTSWSDHNGNLCDTTLVTQTSRTKLVDTSGMSDRKRKEAILEFLKAKLDDAKSSAKGDGFLEATLINDDSWTVIMKLKDGNYIEEIPSLAVLYYGNANHPVTVDDSLRYYSEYKNDKVSALTVGEIVITEVTYNVSGWVSDWDKNYAKVVDVNGNEVRRDYIGGTIGNSVKDIQDLDPTPNPEEPDKEPRQKLINYTFVPAYYITGDAKYDAATANWGNGWRMPTTKELGELYLFCTWEFVGNGYKVTGPNGNSIFLPAAGYRHGDKQYGNGNSGWYASGEIVGTYAYPSMASQDGGSQGEYSSIENMPSVLIFQHGQYNTVNVYNNMSTAYGFSIRPVANLLK